MLVDFIEGLVNTIFGDGALLDASNLKISSGVIGMSNKMWAYFAIFGIALTLFYFILEMNNKYALEGRDMNFKTMFLPFLKLMVAIAVLSQGAKIVSALLGIHNSLMDTAHNGFSMSVASGSTDDSTDSIMDAIRDLNLFAQIVSIIPLLLCWLVSIIITFVWWYKAIGFKMELLFRIGVTPVAFADLYSGQNGNAIRWLKGFLAFSIYGAAFFVLPKFAQIITADTLASSAGSGSGVVSGLWGFLKAIVMSFAAPIAALGTLGAVRSLAKEALQ